MDGWMDGEVVVVTNRFEKEIMEEGLKLVTTRAA